MKNLESQCNLGDVTNNSGANTREDFLLETITMPKNIKQLTERLPKSNYGNTVEGCQSKRESMANFEGVYKRSSILA